MTALLEQLQLQFATSTADITSKIINLRKGEGESSIIVEQLDTSFDEVRETLEQIDLEIRSLPVEERRSRQKHLDGFNDEFKRLQIDFANAKMSLNSPQETRIELLDGDLEDGDANTQLLNESERKESSRRKMDGFGEGLGSQVLGTLAGQREALGRTRERLRKGNYELGRSTRITHMVLRKAMQNKLIVYTIAIIFSLTFIIIVYRSLFSSP